MFLSLEQFYSLIAIMAIVAVFVFIALRYIKVGYGIMNNNKWGFSINNKVAWFLMEVPVFLVVFYLWYHSPRRFEAAPLIIFLFFQLHYFQRSFIFPLLLKGKSKMPIIVVIMGIIFNSINGLLQGEWLFYLSDASQYSAAWLTTPQFIAGSIIFFAGMAVNWHSDYVIRHLRAPGDTKHYLPSKGMYRYVTSANYFGEIVEWTGFAILTWSLPGALFALWTMANLVPRANAIYHKYENEFGDEFTERDLKRVFPRIY